VRQGYHLTIVNVGLGEILNYREYLHPMLRKLLSLVLFSIYGIVGGWILLFLLVEFIPGILNIIPLQKIQYYAQKIEYVSDPKLVFIYRQSNYVRRVSFVGDLYSPSYGIPVKPVDYVATYDANGFRKNSSESPYDIAVIGDSYIEIGESDEKTFTELLKRETGLSVLNIGRGWYGPYQYLELLRRHALEAKPKYVIVAFFAGNDFNDIAQYEAWKSGGQYYLFRDLDKKNILSRFALASGDIGNYFRRKIQALLRSKGAKRPDESFFGIINIGNKQVPMMFPRWEREITKREIMALRSILSEFKALCHENQIIPLVVYIPTATQVYADLYSPDSNSHFIARVMNHPANPSLQAIASLANELNIDLINLLPLFKKQAAEGNLLYYPFDTHWNVEGRRTAASFIAAYFDKSCRLRPCL
jgi:hypothetical protein